MKSYKITINVTDVVGMYSANNIEEAHDIAQSECDEIYTRLRGRCSVEVESVEEIRD